MLVVNNVTKNTVNWFANDNVSFCIESGEVSLLLDPMVPKTN